MKLRDPARICSRTSSLEIPNTKEGVQACKNARSIPSPTELWKEVRSHIKSLLLPVGIPRCTIPLSLLGFLEVRVLCSSFFTLPPLFRRNPNSGPRDDMIGILDFIESRNARIQPWIPIKRLRYVPKGISPSYCI